MHHLSVVCLRDEQHASLQHLDHRQPTPIPDLLPPRELPRRREQLEHRPQHSHRDREWLLRDASFATLLILRSIPNLILRLRFWNRKRLLSMLLINESPMTSRDLTLPSFNSRRVFDNWRRVGWRPQLQTVAMGHQNTPIGLILNGLGNAWISRLPHNAKRTAPWLVKLARATAMQLRCE